MDRKRRRDDPAPHGSAKKRKSQQPPPEVDERKDRENLQTKGSCVMLPVSRAMLAARAERKAKTQRTRKTQRTKAGISKPKARVTLRVPTPATIKRELARIASPEAIVLLHLRKYALPASLADISNRFAQVSFALWLAMSCAYHARVIGRMAEAVEPIFNTEYLAPHDAWSASRNEVLKDEAEKEALHGEMPFVRDPIGVLRMVQQAVNSAASARANSDSEYVRRLYASRALMKHLLRFLLAMFRRLGQFKKLKEEDCNTANMIADVLYKISQCEMDPHAESAPSSEQRLMTTCLLQQDNLRLIFKYSADYMEGKEDGPLYAFGKPLSGFAARIFATLNVANMYPGISANLWKQLNEQAKDAVLPAVQRRAFSHLTQGMLLAMKKPFKTNYKIDRVLVFVGLHGILRHRLAVSSSMRSFLVDSVINQLQFAAENVDEYVVNASIRLLPAASNGLELLLAAFSSAKVQDELLLGSRRDEFLGAVEKLLSVMNKKSHTRIVLNPAKEAKHFFGLSTREQDFNPFKVMNRVPKAEKEHENRARAFGFTLKLVSLFDTNVVHALTTLKSFDINKLFTCLYRIQRATDRYCQVRNNKDVVEKVEIVTHMDATEFVVRLNWLREQMMRIEAEEKKVVPKPPGAPKNTEKIVFPKLETSEVAKVLGTKEKIRNFEDDAHLLGFIAKQLGDNAGEALARFDPTWQRYPKWSRIIQNVYVGKAKELLSPDCKKEVEFCKCLTGADGLKCRDESCENIAMKMECTYKCGASCLNRRLQKGLVAKASVQFMDKKGYGFIAEQDLKKGDLIAEYCGEVIDVPEFEKRVKDYEDEKHFYFMALTKSLTIDASRRSGISRYINHSCEPNAQAEKWIAGSEPHVAIIAKGPIKKGTEVTFDYDAISLSARGRQCHCGSSKCKGNLTRRDDVRIDTLSKKTLDKRSSLKTRQARKMMKQAGEIAKRAKAMHNIQKDLVADEKALEQWRKAQQEKVNARKKPSKGCGPAAAGRAAGSARVVVPKEKKKKSWGFVHLEKKKEEKAGTNALVGTTAGVKRKNPFQPFERKEDKLKRLGYIVPDDGTKPWKKKHKTELELKIENYDSDVSDYSYITDNVVVPVEEDNWEYDLPEVFDINPYANRRDKGRYGSPIDRIDNDVDSGLFIERHYHRRKEEHERYMKEKQKQEEEERRHRRVRGGPAHAHQQHMQHYPPQQQQPHYPRHHQGQHQGQRPPHHGDGRHPPPHDSRHHGGPRHPQHHHGQRHPHESQGGARHPPHATSSRHHPPPPHHQDRGAPRHYHDQGGHGGPRHHPDHGAPRNHPDHGPPRNHQDQAPRHHQDRNYPHQGGGGSGPRHPHPRPGGPRHGHYGGGGGAPRHYGGGGGPTRHGGGPGPYGRGPPPGRHSHPGHGHRRGPPPSHHRNSYGGGGGYPPNRRPQQRR